MNIIWCLFLSSSFKNVPSSMCGYISFSALNLRGCPGGVPVPPVGRGILVERRESTECRGPRSESWLLPLGPPGSSSPPASNGQYWSHPVSPPGVFGPIGQVFLVRSKVTGGCGVCSYFLPFPCFCKAVRRSGCVKQDSWSQVTETRLQLA